MAKQNFKEIKEHLLGRLFYYLNISQNNVYELPEVDEGVKLQRTKNLAMKHDASNYKTNPYKRLVILYNQLESLQSFGSILNTMKVWIDSVDDVCKDVENFQDLHYKQKLQYLDDRQNTRDKDYKKHISLLFLTRLF